MRRTADGDLAPFDKIDARLAGFYANIIPTTQGRLGVSVYNFHGHRPLEGNGFAFNGDDGVIRGIVRACCGGRNENSAEKSDTWTIPNCPAAQSVNIDSSGQSAR